MVYVFLYLYLSNKNDKRIIVILIDDKLKKIHIELTGGDLTHPGPYCVRDRVQIREVRDSKRVIDSAGKLLQSGHLDVSADADGEYANVAVLGVGCLGDAVLEIGDHAAIAVGSQRLPVCDDHQNIGCARPVAVGFREHLAINPA